MTRHVARAVLGRNVRLGPPEKISSWRKASLGIWSSVNDASIYARLEIDATGILERIKELKADGIMATPTALVGLAAAKAIRQYPQLNSIVRFGRVYQRQEINVFFQVTAGRNGEDVSGVSIKQCDQKDIEDICVELRERSIPIREQKDPDFKRKELLNKLLPGVFVKPFLGLTSFVLYDLNLYFPFYAEKDFFGSVMVSGLGMFGVDEAFIPLLGFTRCPVAVAVGRVRHEPIVDKGEVVVRPMLTLGVTLDHRLVDGAGAGRLLRAFKKHLRNPS